MKPWVLPSAGGIIALAYVLAFLLRAHDGPTIIAPVLLVLGACMALMGVRDLRIQFNTPSLLDRAATALLQPPRDANVEVVGVVATGKVGMFLDLSARRSVTADQPIDAIVAGINYNIEQLTTELTEARTELRNAGARLDRRISEENARLERALSALRQDLESATTGGLDLAAAGLWFVIAGTVLPVVACLVDLSG